MWLPNSFAQRGIPETDRLADTIFFRIFHSTFTWYGNICDARVVTARGFLRFGIRTAMTVSLVFTMLDGVQFTTYLDSWH